MTTNKKPFSDVDGHTLAQAIVDTVREPLIVLDGDLRVIAAIRIGRTKSKSSGNA